MLPTPLRGVIVPILTPLDESGNLWLDAFEPLIELLIHAKVAGLFPCGTTGEGPLLTQAERCQVAETVVKLARGRLPVIIHTGDVNTERTLYLTRHAQHIGADGAAIIPPYFYNLPDQALGDFYIQIARSVPEFPIFFYNNPPVSNNTITYDVVKRVCEQCDNVVGIKDSSGNIEMLNSAKSLCGESFTTGIGTDRLIATSILSGVDACVSGNANVVPELVVALFDAAAAGNETTARALQKRLDSVRVILGDGLNLSLFKAMLRQRGVFVGDVRSPLALASEEHVNQCIQAIVELDPGLLTPFSSEIRLAK